MGRPAAPSAEQGSFPFAIDAAGRPPGSVTRWTIQEAPAGTLGFVGGVARCGESLFVAEPMRGRIRRLDVARQSQRGTILIEGPDGRVQMPSGLAIDCAGRRLYVLDMSPPSLVTLSLPEARLVRKQPLPLGFSPVSSLPQLGLDAATGTLYFAGLQWPDGSGRPADREQTRFYASLRVGFAANAERQEFRPIVEPYERGCRGWGACARPSIDRIHGGGRETWVMALPTAVQVGIYDEESRLARTVGIRSPLYQTDGSTSQRGGHDVTWQRSNSVILAVFAFDNVIATVHTTMRVPDGWVAGQPVGLDVLLNLHGFDGTALVSDVRLPGPPVGRDRTSLYVADYGPTGRMQDVDRADIVAVSIDSVRAGVLGPSH